MIMKQNPRQGAFFFNKMPFLTADWHLEWDGGGIGHVPFFSISVKSTSMLSDMALLFFLKLDLRHWGLTDRTDA